jgi:methylated-DNA-[protein]-cysteine S-methyltransferase
VRLLLPEADDAATRARVLSSHPRAREVKTTGAARAARAAIEAVQAHLANRIEGTGLDAIALDARGLPPFHAVVYEALRRVPSGATVSYGELAARVGSPGASRAVGQAVGKNPWPVVVPCHRVLAVGGRPGGFSAPGGVETKRRLLAIEGVTLGPASTSVSASASASQRAAGGQGALPFDAQEAVAHLRARDARLARVIDGAGPLRLELAHTHSTFEALARSIVFQQLAGKAAAAIHGRLCALFPRKRLRAEAIADASDALLRGAGLSRGKILALRDLAAKTLDGTVPAVRALHAMNDDAIVERLVQVRGIGRWTVEMLLIFRLGRPDVLPVGDFGVRHGFQLTYRKRALPTPKELARHAEKWRPFRTVASWYMWRAVELARREKTSGQG